MSLATESAVVLATSGLVPEVLQNLLKVEPFISADTDPGLTAQYWQWVGRVGKDGRLPARRSVEVLGGTAGKRAGGAGRRSVVMRPFVRERRARA